MELDAFVDAGALGEEVLESMREATFSMDSTCRNDEDSLALLLVAAALAEEDVATLGDELLVKAEGDVRFGVAGLLPTRLTGFHALEEDSATRLRKLSSASSRAASHCALDF